MHPLWDPRRWRTGNKTWLHCGRVQRGAGLCGCVVLRTYDSGRAARKTCGEESWGCKKSGFLSEFDVFALLDRVMWCFFCLRCRSASPEKWHFIHDVTAIRYCVMRQQKAGFKGSVHIFNLNPGGFSGNVRSVGFICTFIYPLDVCVPIEGRRDEVLLHANLVVSIALILSTESLVGFFQLDFVLLQKIHSAANTSLWHFHILFSNMIIKLHSSRMTATSPALSLLLCYAIHILLNDQPTSWKVSESSCLLSWRLMSLTTCVISFSQLLAAILKFIVFFPHILCRKTKRNSLSNLIGPYFICLKTENLFERKKSKHRLWARYNWKQTACTIVLHSDSVKVVPLDPPGELTLTVREIFTRIKKSLNSLSVIDQF